MTGVALLCLIAMVAQDARAFVFSSPPSALTSSSMRIVSLRCGRARDALSGMRMQEKKRLVSSDPYKVLGVERNAAASEIRCGCRV
eukprot:764374-Hanusia_phi.AAC.3